MSTQVFRINYKSDFVLNLQCDAGWAIPFTIKFWSKGLPTSHYFVSYDGITYTNCSVLDDPTVLRATFDDHHLGCGELMFQITYSMDVDDFRTHIEDDVMNVSSVTIEQDGQPVQVVLNFEGETAPEIAYAMPAFAAEAARVAAEAQRVLAEAQREENELARQQAETQRQTEFEAAQEERREAFEQSQEEQDAAFSSAQQSRAQSFSEQAADFESRYTTAEQRRDTSFNASQTARQNTFEGSERQRTASYQAAEGTEAGSVAGDGSRWGEFKEAEAQRDTILNDKMQFVDEFAQDVEDNYAKKDGAYEEMLAGSALNLVDTSGSPVLREFTFDTAGGSDDIGTGSALIKKMRGNTIVWNQKMKDDVVAGTSMFQWHAWNNSTNLTVNNNILSFVGQSSPAIADYNMPLNTIILNHVYCISAEVKTSAEGRKVYLGGYGIDTIISGSPWNIQSSNWQRIAHISKCNVSMSNNNQVARIRDYRKEEWDAVEIKNFMFIDLTQMFGAGNEPSTVEEFEKLFPMPYYDYNEGQLLSFNGNSIKTVGFNQLNIHRTVEYTKFTRPTDNASPFLNENIVIKGISGNGYIDPATISDYTIVGNSITIKTTDISYSAPYGVGFPVKVFPNTRYCIRAVRGANTGSISLSFYTDDSFITYINIGEASNMRNGVTIDTPSNARWIIFGFKPNVQNGTDSFSDICVNLSWSGTRNGTYEPYQEHVHNISFYKTIKDGDGNLLFPNGLLSAGSVYDEVTATKAIKRVGVVDLGTMEWSYNNTEAGHERFASISINSMIKIPSSNDVVGNVISPRFAASNANDNYLHQKDNTISVGQSGAIFIYSSDYTDAASFKAALQGVMLYYELAEPIEVDFEEQNMAYQVNDYGTEQLLPENTSTPTTTPAMLDVTYGINAVDTIKNLPRNYLAQDDLDRLLSAMGSALGFTYTKTWNETDKQWSFTVTKTATTNDENV